MRGYRGYCLKTGREDWTDRRSIRLHAITNESTFSSRPQASSKLVFFRHEEVQESRQTCQAEVLRKRAALRPIFPFPKGFGGPRLGVWLSNSEILL